MPTVSSVWPRRPLESSVRRARIALPATRDQAASARPGAAGWLGASIAPQAQNPVNRGGGVLPPAPVLSRALEAAPVRLPRFRLRTLMIAVAAVAVIGAGTIYGRARIRQVQAAQHTARAMRWRNAEAIASEGLTRVDQYALNARDAGDVVEFADWSARAKLWLADIVRYRKLAEHYQRLGEKYDRAARYPWLPVPPDPPPPE
jgi:hypothetical protein